MDFEELFEQAPVPIVILQEGRLVHANAAAHGMYRRFGHPLTGARLSALDADILVAPEERAEASRNLRLVLESGQTLRNIPRTLVDASGHRTAALVSIGPCSWRGRPGVLLSCVLLGLGPATGGAPPDEERLVDDRVDLLRELTPREAEVVLLLAEGAESGEIAARLGIRPSTLRGYVKSIYRKLGVHSKSELVRRVHGQK